VRWSERLLLFAASAVVLVAVDQVVKATVSTPLWAFHQRSYGWVALSIAVLAGAVLLTLVPSRAVAVAAANRVPNPLVIGNFERGFAFNLADVFFLAGNLLLMAALVAMVVRRRDRLAPPRAWERALLRQLHVGG
jgi:hypothetical protein